MTPTRLGRTIRRVQRALADRCLMLGPDAGASTVEVLGWAAVSTLAIVAIGAALQVLGLDLINYVRGQLGL
jgi:hypothetical protein